MNQLGIHEIYVAQLNGKFHRGFSGKVSIEGNSTPAFYVWTPVWETEKIGRIASQGCIVVKEMCL